MAQDGVLRASIGAHAVELSITSFLALLAVLLLLFWAIAKSWFWIKYGFARRKERKLRRLQEQGLAALTLTFGALAGNDLRLAQKAQRRAAKLLGPQPLVEWMGAELASRRGDENAAVTAYQRLTKDPAAALLGWRGLLRTRPHGDSKQLLERASAALADKTVARQSFVHDVRLQELALRGDWAAAVLALHSAENSGAYSRARARILATVIEIMYASSLRTTDAARALEILAKAYKRAPNTIPTVLAYLEAILQQHDTQHANKVIRAVWPMAPHPELLAMFIRTNEKESPIARLQRFEAFAVKRKDHVVTQLALARLCLDAEVYGKARTHVQQAQAIQLSREGFQLLADLAQAEQGNDALAHDYIRQAMRTKPVGQWACTACNSQPAEWQPICQACNALAEVQWHENAPSGIALLQA